MRISILKGIKKQSPKQILTTSYVIAKIKESKMTPKIRFQSNEFGTPCFNCIYLEDKNFYLDKYINFECMERHCGKAYNKFKFKKRCKYQRKISEICYCGASLVEKPKIFRMAPRCEKCFNKYLHDLGLFFNELRIMKKNLIKNIPDNCMYYLAYRRRNIFRILQKYKRGRSIRFIKIYHLETIFDNRSDNFRESFWKDEANSDIREIYLKYFPNSIRDYYSESNGFLIRDNSDLDGGVDFYVEGYSPSALADVDSAAKK